MVCIVYLVNGEILLNVEIGWYFLELVDKRGMEKDKCDVKVR